VSRREQTGLEDELGPVLPGPGATDYERYLRTDELLALQKPEGERAHHDELLFQVTHQSSELWLKLAAAEVETATGQLRDRDLRAAIRSLRRGILALKLITEQLDMLELMSPWEYTSGVRPVLGHGSGFDSPGWNALRHVLPSAGEAFHELWDVRNDLTELAREAG
jgi:tryptophan 2,3-dioxygenase